VHVQCSDAKDVATAPQWAQLSVVMALNPFCDEQNTIWVCRTHYDRL